MLWNIDKKKNIKPINKIIFLSNKRLEGKKKKKCGKSTSRTFFTIFLQQILSYRLLLTIIGQNSNLTGGFKLDPVTT